MAEVPEVETLVRDLCSAVVGRTIQHVDVLQPATIRFPAPDEFVALLENRRVTDAQRKGKYILMPLAGDLVLATHMMLWGTLALVPSTQPRTNATLISWHLDRDEDLRLIDTLGYARAAIGAPQEVAQRLNLDSIGPDALDPTFTADVLARRLAKKRGVLRTVLIDQHVLSGLGIRDADESLWLAQIDPRRAPNSLTPDEIARLCAAIVQILNEGLALRGTQRDLFGRKGQAKHGRYVFEQAGKSCPRCGTPIAHLRVAARNMYFCPNCQH